MRKLLTQIAIIKAGYRLKFEWECKVKIDEKEIDALEEKFIPYPYFMVYDFEAILKKVPYSASRRGENLTITQKHVPSLLFLITHRH